MKLYKNEKKKRFLDIFRIILIMVKNKKNLFNLNINFFKNLNKLKKSRLKVFEDC